MINRLGVHLSKILIITRKRKPEIHLPKFTFECIFSFYRS